VFDAFELPNAGYLLIEPAQTIKKRCVVIYIRIIFMRVVQSGCCRKQRFGLLNAVIYVTDNAGSGLNSNNRYIARKASISGIEKFCLLLLKSIFFG